MFFKIVFLQFTLDWDDSNPIKLSATDLEPNTVYDVNAYAIKDGFNGTANSIVVTTGNIFS